MTKNKKFRVWDTAESEWSPPELFALIGSGHTLRYNREGRWVRTIPDDRWIFVWYTSLKDKNGSEIFEGDVVREGSEKYEVVWSNLHYWLHSTKGKVHGVELMHDNCTKRYEVIGNRYENPDLLEK